MYRFMQSPFFITERSKFSVEEKMICEKCGNEMNVVKQELSCSCICPKCNWGWATSCIDPIKADNVLYSVSIEKTDISDMGAVKVISKAKNCNFLEAKTFLLQGGIVLQALAPEIKAVCEKLTNLGINYTITPEFPYEIVPPPKA